VRSCFTVASSRSRNMFKRSSIAVRTLVWLTAILLPAEAMTVYSCGCAAGDTVVVQSRVRQCCGKAGKRCCCGKVKGQGGCCCCKGKSGSISSCQCAKGGPAHDQAPSTNAKNQTAKTLVAAHAAPAADSQVVCLDPPTAVHLLFMPAQSSMERLSTLCRLVV
jgi:hypothetical protein